MTVIGHPRLIAKTKKWVGKDRAVKGERERENLSKKVIGRDEEELERRGLGERGIKEKMNSLCS